MDLHNGHVLYDGHNGQATELFSNRVHRCTIKIIKGLFQYDYSQRTRRYRVSSFMSSHIGFRPLIYNNLRIYSYSGNAPLCVDLFLSSVHIFVLFRALQGFKHHQVFIEQKKRRRVAPPFMTHLYDTPLCYTGELR